MALYRSIYIKSSIRISSAAGLYLGIFDQVILSWTTGGSIAVFDYTNGLKV